jgi:prepilin-type N-terminal cleavage/methylation domain-containing protein
MKALKHSRGFTLIELMVVIAVIGLLSSIIVVILTSARTDSRDTKRVADLKEITTALQLYYDTYNTYPSALSELVPTYIVIEPTDPVGQAPYYYDVLSGGAGYHLGANLEDATHQALNADKDTVSDTINGSDASDCGGGSISGRRCYDIGP